MIILITIVIVIAITHHPSSSIINHRHPSSCSIIRQPLSSLRFLEESANGVPVGNALAMTRGNCPKSPMTRRPKMPTMLLEASGNDRAKLRRQRTFETCCRRRHNTANFYTTNNIIWKRKYQNSLWNSGGQKTNVFNYKNDRF